MGEDRATHDQRWYGMTTNRLAVSAQAETIKLQANEWAALAREKQNAKAIAAWDQRAKELGQERIPNGITIRFREDKTPYRTSFQA